MQAPVKFEQSCQSTIALVHCRQIFMSDSEKPESITSLSIRKMKFSIHSGTIFYTFYMRLHSKQHKLSS